MNDNSVNEAKKEFENRRNSAMTFAGLVYGGVVLACTTLFISFIMLAFPSNAFFTRAVMGVAGLLVGLSMIAFPFALHNWAVTGNHHRIASLLYYGEMAIVALNTVVSFASLLFKNASLPLPEWVAWYEPFSVISIVYTLAAWGTIFLTDPNIKARETEHAAQVEFDKRVSEKTREFLDTVEGEDAIALAAVEKIRKNFNTETGKRHFGSGRVTSSGTVTRIPELDEPIVMGKNGKNGINP
jgi:hypothetical protein